MLDFLFYHPQLAKGVWNFEPDFQIMKSKDLMTLGGDFYAIWVEERNEWSTDENDAVRLIDQETDIKAEEWAKLHEEPVKPKYVRVASNRLIKRWHQYCKEDLRQNYHNLDERIIFSNTKTTKEDYASKRLDYPLEPCPTPAYDRLMSVLYSPEERHKIEWAIGSVINGDSKKIQKFVVFFGAAGTGKSTVLNIIQMLFKGYFCVFDSKALGSANSQFALEPFKNNPLVAIQHDGDLSKIEDNTRINSLVSHEIMSVNEKHKSLHSEKFKCFLFMGTNRPVKITDAKSGLLRRLIDVSPTGDKIPSGEYAQLIKQIEFELGGIAWHCKEVYEAGPSYYDNYIPKSMLGASNDFYNFVMDSYYVFKERNETTVKAAWEMYKTYCDFAKVPYPYSFRTFTEEIKNYFDICEERHLMPDGTRVRNYLIGFKADKFEDSNKEEPKDISWLSFEEQHSIFDDICKDCPAQYATDSGVPSAGWDSVKTKLTDISTANLHYVRVPENHIVIDFDIPDENGDKSYELNYKEAVKWPPTYAELSKSGQGIHLHYIYTGDPSKLSHLYDDKIEIKVFTGKSSLRRKLTKCNDIPIASISSGLPLKGEKLVNFDGVKDDRHLRNLIKKAIKKQIFPSTHQNVNYIYDLLEDMHASGASYCVPDELRKAIWLFAINSTNQSEDCLKMYNKMKFQSDDIPEGGKEEKEAKPEDFVFFDVEVFPNLFIINWKIWGDGRSVVRMINPKPADIEGLLKMKLIGFNNLRYDNLIVYAAYIGYNNIELYHLSQSIISNKSRDKTIPYNAKDISYTDIYDFSSEKKSLKKFEIDMIKTWEKDHPDNPVPPFTHKELGLRWDEPVPEELWTTVAEYCDNDVLATEALFNTKDRQADFQARKILADLAGMTVNNTTNQLTTRIIFEGNRNPQSEFRYRNMGDTKQIAIQEDDWTCFDLYNRPIFPGYSFEFGKSMYRGEEVGEGGYVYAPENNDIPGGMFGNVALLDIASMHPSSIIAEDLFGPTYTKRFKDILDTRILIKHKEFDKARSMFDGKLSGYLDDPKQAKALSGALKIAINSVYGLTSAKFDNAFRDIRNVDNIVAKRGALFMINLKHEVEDRGFKVAHIKTDSIKIPDATPEIIQFVMDYGKKYGYNFEHEATYDRMCLVNDAVYIAKYKSKDWCKEYYGYIPEKNEEHENEWTATGTQFQVPFVFKKLFSHEPITAIDTTETKSVSTALYLCSNYEEQDESKKYDFIGKVGLFCPMVKGYGGQLMRETVDKDGSHKGYAAAVGTTGYLWAEYSTVKTLGLEKFIDKSYYEKLCNDAIDDISKRGDYEWFVSDDPYVAPLIKDGKPTEAENVEWPVDYIPW